MPEAPLPTARERALRAVGGLDDREPARLQALLDRTVSAQRSYSDQDEGYSTLVSSTGRHAALPNTSQPCAVEADNADPPRYLAL